MKLWLIFLMTWYKLILCLLRKAHRIVKRILYFTNKKSEKPLCEIGGWVDVKDRLPEAGEWEYVLCCNVKDGWVEAAAYIPNMGARDRNVFINIKQKRIFPTHWMPLAELPGENHSSPSQTSITSL